MPRQTALPPTLAPRLIGREAAAANRSRAERIADKYVARDGGPPKPSSDEAPKECSPDEAPTEMIERLKTLDLIQYDRKREAAAEVLGVRVATLDKEVKAARKSSAGRSTGFEEVDRWPEPVDGAELLDEMSATIKRHIVLTDAQADTVALWCVYTHGYAAFRIAPRLGIRAPTHGCGKSELLMRIERLVARPLPCDNVTPAVLFRLIEALHPTLILDELDNNLPENKGDLLGVMNAGYNAKGIVYRCGGDDNGVRGFSVFGPLAYAMIGQSSVGSFNSRSIPIDMRRATPAEKAALASFEDGNSEYQRLTVLGRKAARWVDDHVDELKAAEPDMGKLVNRLADNWKPLFAVADRAGGGWSERARAAAQSSAEVQDKQSLLEELFAEIKAILEPEDKAPTEEITSKQLVDQLIGIEGGRWAEYGKQQKPITQNALARLLKDFGIRPDDVGPEHARRKGYKRWQFREVFEAYLALPHDSIRAAAQNAMNAEQVARSQPRSEECGRADGICEKPNDHGLLRSCADEKVGCEQQEDDGLDIPAIRRGAA
jgi:putative DNA primase/helicase